MNLIRAFLRTRLRAVNWICPIVLLFVGTVQARAERLIVVAGGGTGADRGAAVGAKMDKPFCMAFNPAGELLIGEYGGQVVRKVDAKGAITTIAGTGKKGSAGDGGPALQAEFNGIHDLVIAGNGDVYLSDSFNRRVRKIDPKSGIITTIAGNGDKKSSGDGGPADKAGLDGVASLFFSPAGDKLLLTGFSSAVRIIDLKSGIINTVPGFPGGRSLAVDSKGNVYVAGGVTLRVLRADGKQETLLDAKNTGGSGLALGKNPKHLAIDLQDNVIIADEEHHLIRKYIVAEKKLVTLAGNGKPGAAGINGPPADAQVNRPHGVYVDPAGTLYIADSWNDRVLRIGQ